MNSVMKATRTTNWNRRILMMKIFRNRFSTDLALSFSSFKHLYKVGLGEVMVLNNNLKSTVAYVLRVKK